MRDICDNLALELVEHLEFFGLFFTFETVEDTCFLVFKIEMIRHRHNGDGLELKNVIVDKCIEIDVSVVKEEDGYQVHRVYG